MFIHNIELRVRYGETDRMGYAYYGNYGEYFEVARVEALRSVGVSYKELEDQGVLLPVLEYKVKFFKPAFYDDVLRIETQIEPLNGARIHFTYKTYNSAGDQLNEASTTLVFVDKLKGRPISAPQWIKDKLS